jgi:drug/metabolite transporter (DMT)-like permease
LGAGALTLVIVTRLAGTTRLGLSASSSWVSGLVLLLYAVPFSFAYVSLTAGTGALVLFGAVQVTMLLTAHVKGERSSWLQWVGLVAAIAGLVWLVLPAVAAPPLDGVLLMALAGMAWGAYSLRGRSAHEPLAHTAATFVWAAPLSMLAIGFCWSTVHADAVGLLLALVSGAVTSGLGYVAWHAAIRGLTATRAAVVQLTVPVLAAIGGVVFIGERLSLRLAVSAAAVLGGVCMALLGRARSAATHGRS